MDLARSFDSGPDYELSRIMIPPALRWKRIGDVLLELGFITLEQRAEAIERQRENGEPLGQVLVDLGYIEERIMLMVLAAQKDVVPCNLEGREFTPEILSMLEPDFCRRNQCLPVELTHGKLMVAMRNPLDIELIDAMEIRTGYKIEPALPSLRRLEAAIDGAYARDRRNDRAKVDELVQDALGLVSHNRAGEAAGSQNLENLEEETRPVIGIVNKILADGIRMKASDIHIEPTQNALVVRYRIDGRLLKSNEIPAKLIPMVTARIKIMAELDPLEWRIPQDGRMSVDINGTEIDVRLSILPSMFGSRIVMRLLDRNVGLKRLEELGFSEANLRIFRTLIRRPYGLFLVTGPTGSGKTTSLYAALNEVKDEESNIITCEDPVEYNIDGISQSQVNPKIGLTFAAQLRSILRQDPDIILVGEIRDQETAETAIRAAMTGHMVFSTLHCNDAPGAIPRLLDMGVDPFLLSTSLIGVMGQRLLRVLCQECRTADPATEEELRMLQGFGDNRVEKIWHATGCPSCHEAGYRGRMAVHEIMPVTHEVAAMLASRAPIEEITNIARLYGYRTMQQDAYDRVLAGRTTLKEAQRLIAFDDIPRMDQAA
jgi:type IV pilus assembly protein PilB